MNILLATTRKADLGGFIRALQQAASVQVKTAGSADKVLDAVRKDHPQLVIVDDICLNQDGLRLITDIIRLDPMINTALITSLSKKQFHDRSEGLGILARLQENPGPEEAVNLADALKKVVG